MQRHPSSLCPLLLLLTGHSLIVGNDICRRARRSSRGDPCAKAARQSVPDTAIQPTNAASACRA